MIKVLLAEDSAVQRELLLYVLGQDRELSVAGVARNGAEAIVLARELRPDVIVMDVHMPQIDGFEATREILAETPTPIVMVSASVGSDEVRLSFEALQAGALTFVAKPPGLDHPDHADSAGRLICTVKLMSEVKVVRRWRRPGGTPAVPPAQPSGRKIRIVAIGASTGGPRAISEMLAEVSPLPGAAILIVQHMAPGFTPGFGEWLAHQTGLPVRVAESGDPVAPGRVYLAPDKWQMGVTASGRISLQPGAPGDGFCPSVSHLFDSVAEAYGPAAMGIILTGMGRDGAEGLLRLRRAGGVTVAQDAETCVVFGMPKDAIALGAVDHVLPPDQIAALVRAMTSQGGTGRGGN